MSRSSKLVVLDVRAELALGRRPLDQIMEAAKALRCGESLQVITPFEPLPLVALLKRLGLKRRSRRLAQDHWETLFAARLPQEPAQREASAPSAPSPQGGPIVVDARGLEPPQPMVTILIEAEKLRCAESLEARTDRRPLHLINALHDRGFKAESTEQADGSWCTRICRG